MRSYIKIIGSLFIGISIVSCTSMNYNRDTQVAENLYRTDNLPQDTVSIATKPWKEFFTDATLQTHISDALENNIDVRIALQNILAAEAYAKQSKHEFFPSLGVGANYGHETPSVNAQLPYTGQRAYLDLFDISATFSWDLDIWGRINSQKKAALAGYLSSVAGHQYIKSDLIKTIAVNYYLLLSLDKQKEILDKTVKLREDYLETTKALKEAGMLTEVAVQQSEALALNARASMVSVENQIKLIENVLSILKGKPSAPIARTSFDSQVIPNDLKLGYSSQLLANRPDVMMAEHELVRAFEMTKVAKKSFYPSLKITASGGFQSLEEIDNLFNAKSLFGNLLAGLTQPLIAKRQIRTQYEVSLANKEKAYLNFKKSLLFAGKEVSDALSTYSTQEKFIEYKEKEYKAYKQSVDYSIELLNNGMANYLEVLNASQNMLVAELNVVDARFTQMKSVAELYVALGGGWRE